MATNIEIALNKHGVPVLKGLKSLPPGNDEVHSYIVQKSKELGIDPKVSLEVWAREGKAGWQSNFVKNCKRERSYGPFQLFVDGGLGNKFIKETGLDPSDPANWKQGVDFALGEAKKGGWGPWYGAKAAGITGFEGIGGNPANFTAGGAYSPSPTASSAPGTPGVVPKPTLAGYKWGGSSEAIQPSTWKQMAPSFASEVLGTPQKPQGYMPAQDLTGVAAPAEGLVQEFAAPNPQRMAGDVVDFPGGLPQGWSIEDVRKIAKEYGVGVPEIVRMLRGMQSNG